MPNNIIITPGNASIEFSGSADNKIKLQVNPSGSVGFISESVNLLTIDSTGIIITGSINTSNGGITGSLFGTSSWASNAISSSFAISASWAPGGAGATFPFSGAAAITGSLNITGSLFTHTYSLVTSSLGNASGSMSINLSNANYFTATTSASTTWVFSNPPANRAVGFVLALASGGAATQIWPSTIRWPGGAAPTLTSAGGIDILTFITDNTGTTWRGVFSIVDSR